jgi:hypothetical protein
VNQYSLAVDIAVIENLSLKALQIDQLLGRSGGSNQLRKIGMPSAPIGGISLPGQAIMLAPAERLIVPAGLLLLSKQSDVDDEARVDGQKTFRQIAATKRAVFETEIYSRLRGIRAKKDTYSIRKTLESFKPPTYPTHLDYSFGPEWALTGLTIGGENISFGAPAPNLVDIRLEDIGSCPILYVWSGPEGLWFRHGKVLHEAGSGTNEQAESVTFDGFVHRFRIAEEEIERATISGVKLIVEFKNGNSLTLLPESGALAAAKTIALYANDEIDINFALPEDLKDSDVARSRLTITGYYDRYPALLLGELP